jgi:hypothetical protein
MGPGSRSLRSLVRDDEIDFHFQTANSEAVIAGSQRVAQVHNVSMSSPAKAGTHNHRSELSMGLWLQLYATQISVVMGPGSRSLRSLVRDDVDL